MAGTVHHAVVAGTFYPADARQLASDVESYLDAADSARPSVSSNVKGLIVPHAAYRYSGAVAGSAYAQLEPARSQVRHVVVLGPTHHVGFRGLAVCDAAAVQTPLGQIPVDTMARERLLALPQVCVLPDAHAGEHSLEVQYPFLQTVLDRFAVLPLAVGAVAADEVAEVIEMVWGGPETLFVVSSDLSHYLDDETAQRMDRATSRIIENLEPRKLSPRAACGYHGIRGFLVAARRHGLRCKTVELRNSAAAQGPQERVVGYGAYVFYD